MDGIHSYTSAAIAVVIGALAAGAYTAYFNHLSTKNQNISDYLNDLKDIEKLAKDYWLFDDCLDKHALRHERIGHELRAKLDATASYDELSRNILGDLYSKFAAFDLELFMVATGGTFQTKDFQPSPERYGEVMVKITEMRALLRQQRISLFWAH